MLGHLVCMHKKASKIPTQDKIFTKFTNFEDTHENKYNGEFPTTLMSCRNTLVKIYENN